MQIYLRQIGAADLTPAHAGSFARKQRTDQFRLVCLHEGVKRYCPSCWRQRWATVAFVSSYSYHSVRPSSLLVLATPKKYPLSTGLHPLLLTQGCTSRSFRLLRKQPSGSLCCLYATKCTPALPSAPNEERYKTKKAHCRHHGSRDAKIVFSGSTSSSRISVSYENTRFSMPFETGFWTWGSTPCRSIF